MMTMMKMQGFASKAIPFRRIAPTSSYGLLSSPPSPSPSTTTTTTITTTTTTKRMLSTRPLLPEADIYQQMHKPWLQTENQLEDENFRKRILQGNAEWVNSKLAREGPSYFSDIAAADQRPRALYIGCSDSRCPAEKMLGFEPGELFVHRNIANMVINTDFSMLSVLQFAVEVLEVKHVIVMGHYGCGGVKASMVPANLGLIDNWLRNIRDVHRAYHTELEAIDTPQGRFKRLVELNVAEQVVNVFKTGFVQRRRIEKGYPRIHGMVYDMSTGKVEEVNVNIREKLSKYKDIYNLYGNAGEKKTGK